MTETNTIQVYNIKTTLTKEFLTNKEEVEKFLAKIRSLKDIAFDLNDKEVVKEVKELKKQAKKSVKVLKEVCEPYEAEGKKIADIRSSISTTLVSGKNNVIDAILQPILEAEAELKKLEETHISSLDIYYVDVKLKELENLLQFNWLVYKDEAMKLINSLKSMALLRKAALEKEEQEIFEKVEQERKEREEEIAKTAAANAVIETENRIKREQESAERQEIDKKLEEQQKSSNMEHKSTIHRQILETIKKLPCQSDGNFAVDMKFLIKEIANGRIPNLYIQY